MIFIYKINLINTSYGTCLNILLVRGQRRLHVIPRHIELVHGPLAFRALELGLSKRKGKIIHLHDIEYITFGGVIIAIVLYYT